MILETFTQLNRLPVGTVVGVEDTYPFFFHITSQLRGAVHLRGLPPGTRTWTTVLRPLGASHERPCAAAVWTPTFTLLLHV